MPVSADTLRLAYVFEDVRGTTPTTPQWDILRTTGEGLTFNPTATSSNEMDASRAVRDSILTGGEVSGDINFELSFNTPFMELFEGAMCSAWGEGQTGNILPAGTPGGSGIAETGPLDNQLRVWGANDIFVGTKLKTYTFEKRFVKDGGGFVYHRYNGCLVNSFTLNITPNEPISGSFSFIGSGLTLANSEIAGSTYDEPETHPVFTALKVTDLSLYGADPGTGDDMLFSDYCFNSATLNINNNARRTACIGPDTLAQVVLGRCEITWDLNVYFADNKILEYLQTQKDLTLVANLRDTHESPTEGKHKFIFRSLRCKAQTGSVVASGTGQDVIAAATFAALIPPDPNTYQGPLTVSRETLAPGVG